MSLFATPLPIPENAIVLTEDEKSILRKYTQRIEAATRQIEIARESINDVGMTISARAGSPATKFKLSADFGCLIPREE